MTNVETSLDTGHRHPRAGQRRDGTEFDIDDLVFMDTATRTKAAIDSIHGGLSFNEARKKYHYVGPVKGGDSPIAQQQMFSLEALAQRDASDPFTKPTPAPMAAPVGEPPTDAAKRADLTMEFGRALRRKAHEQWRRAPGLTPSPISSWRRLRRSGARAGTPRGPQACMDRGAVTEMAVIDLRERAAVLETRGAVPGRSGPPGRDGVDGFGFDDLGVEYDGERTITLKFVHGDQRKLFPIKLVGLPLYRKVWQDGRAYEEGDSVTWAGSEWHCHLDTTTKPGDGSKAWTLKVKRGRDAKDGQEGPPGPPGPPGRDALEQVVDMRRGR